MAKSRDVFCGCGRVAEFVSGTRIYPHRPDLDGLRFFYCVPCDAWVGCHEDGRPMGTLADAATRAARKRAHASFDPLWKYAGEDGARSRFYRWLARKLGIRVEHCHIGLFDEATCDLVTVLAREERQRLKRALAASSLSARARLRARTRSNPAAGFRKERQ